jgi:AcrR family transcriptional regulator
MSEAVPAKLPRGRHQLSREQVVASQQVRMLLAMADAMSEKGFVNTSVADVLKRAGVSRETFYQQFSSKLDCFLHVFDTAGEVLLNRILAARPEKGTTPQERFEIAFGAYMDTIEEHASYARVFLIEVYAAGPEAMARRSALQQRLVDGLVDILGARSKQDRFACQALVAAMASLVMDPLITQDGEALRQVRRDVTHLVRRALS